MHRQIFWTGLAAVVLLCGCLPHKEEPVAQQKSIGRVLETAFQGKRGLQSLSLYAGKVAELTEVALTRGLREDQLRELATAVISGGSKGINNFKKAGIIKFIGEFTVVNTEIAKRMLRKIEGLSEPLKQELDKLAATAPEEAAAFMKKHTDIGDDEVFKRLVEQLGKNLDDFAEVVATNHRLADAVAVELASDSSYGLKKLGISAEQLASELKVSSADFLIDEAVFVSSAKNPADGYKFMQELSGVDVYDEASVLDLLLRKGKDGKHVYLNFSREDLIKLGNPFDKRFTKPIISTDPKYASEHLREFYKTD